MYGKHLSKWISSCQGLIVNAILGFVRDNGEEVTEYEINEFGLDEERMGEGSITKVYNFFDNGGCFFYEPSGVNDETLNDVNENNFYEKTYNSTTHTAYQCLYIVVGEDGSECLKYYRFTNGGLNFDSDQAEPDHGKVENLNLLDLHYIIRAIGLIEGRQELSQISNL